MVPDPNASRIHAEVRHIGLDYFLVDMGSTNGTEVNGQLVKRHALADGDTIVIGTTEIHVELGEGVSETGLLVAEVVFLVLLYAFVWSVVRSSSRQLRARQPPPTPPAPEPRPAAPRPPRRRRRRRAPGAARRSTPPAVADAAPWRRPYAAADGGLRGPDRVARGRGRLGRVRHGTPTSTRG